MSSGTSSGGLVMLLSPLLLLLGLLSLLGGACGCSWTLAVLSAAAAGSSAGSGAVALLPVGGGLLGAAPTSLHAQCVLLSAPGARTHL